MRTGNHARKEKTDSKENAKKEEKHTTRKATGTWQKGTQKTSEGHMIRRRFEKKKKQKQKKKQQQKEKQQNDGKGHTKK